MANKLFTTKSIERLMRESSGEHDGEHTLKRTLGKTNLVMLGIGAIIGAGIFVLTGAAASQHAGPAVVISFVVAGLACAFAGLCYSEFASMIPIAGSAYTYAYATLGEFIAWIIGWDLILEYLFGASTVAVGWSGYMTSFLKDLGIIIPDALCNAPIFYDAATQTYTATGAFLNLPAMAIVGIMTWLLVVGIRESANINNVIVVIKVIVILLFIILGWNYINPENWVPFIPENTGTFGEYGWSGVVRAAGIIFFAYIGFDAVSTAAQEAINPQKDMPFGILGSLVVCTILYILVGLVMTGIVPYLQLNNPAPIAVAIDATGDGLAWLRPIIKIGALAGLSSVILVMLMGQPRIFFSMSKDGLLPKSFGKVHPKYKTPYITTILTGAVVMLVAGIFPIGLLGELVSIGTLLAFVIVCGGVLVLRYKQPNINRPFKTPFFPLVPILGMLSSLALMYFLPIDTWIRLIVWMALGVIIYFGYSRKHSKVNNP
ncbi:MAG: amino acid permease [Bacteroidetes bacterium]|nr:amino acid permease [Bacteroidota bacterium]